MVRAAALCAVSAFCLFWAAGCASTSDPAPKAAPAPEASASPDAMPSASADLATLTKDLPATLDGEIQRADLLRAKGDYDDALRSYAQLMLVAPDNARVVGGYGKVLEQMGRSKDAQAFLKRAVQINSRDWSLESALGVADDQLDDHKGARVAYQRALTLKPGDPTVLNNYAVSLMLAGDYAGAKKMLAEAEARGVSNPKISLNLDKLTSLDDVPAASASPAPKPVVQAAAQPGEAATIKTKPVVIATIAPPAAQPAAAPASPKPIIPAATAQQKTPLIAATVTPAPQKTPLMTATPTVAPQKPMTPATRIATKAPKPLTSTVVMETVPKDPLAGPVKHPEHAAQKLASATHPAAKPASPTKAPTPVAPPPALRTAADGD
jgi:Flp pilus assembly protein TadD